MANLFETPAQVRARIGKTGRESDLSIANTAGSGNLANLAGAQAGRLLAQGIGAENPEITRAKKVQSAIQKAKDVAGTDIKELYKNISSNLADMGETAGALQALQAYQEISFKEAQNKATIDTLGIRKNEETGRNSRSAAEIAFRRDKLKTDKEVANLRLQAVKSKDAGIRERALMRVKASVAKQMDKFVSSKDFAESSIKVLIKSDPELGKFWGGLSGAEKDAMARTIQGKLLQISGNNTLASGVEQVMDFDKALKDAFYASKNTYAPSGDLQMPSSNVIDLSNLDQ